METASRTILLLVVCIEISVICGAAAPTLQRILYPMRDPAGLEAHPLIIKTYPGVDNFQSDIYEVYAEPYHYDLHAASAIAVLQGEGEEGIKGEITFIQREPPAGPVIIRGNITGLSPGKHGLHIHRSGDLRQGCDKLGDHFNPFLNQHGDVHHHVRHVGDLGNVEAGEDGVATIEIVDPVMSLSGGPKGVVGRSLVVTEKEDDLGKGGNADSLVNGNSGKPLACGIISYIR